MILYMWLKNEMEKRKLSHLDGTTSNTESIKSTIAGTSITATLIGTFGTATVGTVGKGIFWTNATGRTASSGRAAAIAGVLGTTLLGTGLGTAGGLWFDNKQVEFNPEKYTNTDGTYNQIMANGVKTLSTIFGVATGFAISVTWGWSWIGITGGIVAIGFGIATTFVNNLA